MKARSALNALKHGMRAAQHVVLPDENAVELNALQALLFEELTPEGALQLVLARRVAVAAWRLARADRLAAGAGLGPIPQAVRRRPTRPGDRRARPFPSTMLARRAAPTLVVAPLALGADVVSARSAKGSQARASRKNGAKSRGPKTPAGKACTSVCEIDRQVR